MKMIANWHKKIWKFWTVRIQIVAAFITSFMFIDPGTLLAAYNMMPHSVRVLLPQSLMQTIGIILFVTNLLTIIARPIAQKKVEKIDEQ